MGTLKYSSKEISSMVESIARNLDAVLVDKSDVVFVCVLGGATIFFSDLVRKVTRKDVMLDFIRVKSYSDNKQTNTLDWILRPCYPLANKTVVIVEDIIDTGNTITKIISEFKEKKCTDIIVCSLLIRHSVLDLSLPQCIWGQTLSEEDFVYGYGLDNNEKERNLSSILTTNADSNE